MMMKRASIQMWLIMLIVALVVLAVVAFIIIATGGKFTEFTNWIRGIF